MKHILGLFFGYIAYFGLVFAKKHVITAACPDGEINLCASNCD